MRQKKQGFPRDKDLVNFLQPERQAINLAYQLCKGDIGIAQDPRAIDLISKSESACNIIKASPVAIATLDASNPITVPTMTSNTAPYGVASDSDGSSTTFYALDNNFSTNKEVLKGDAWIGYMFTLPVWCYKAHIQANSSFDMSAKNIVFQCSFDGTTWSNISPTHTALFNSNIQTFITAFPAGKAQRFRCRMFDNWGNTTKSSLWELQFYCK